MPLYETLYKESPYDLGILAPKTGKKSWYEMSPVEQMRELQSKQTQLAAMPPVPEKKRKKLFKPVLSTLQAITGILNVPSAAISGAVKQLVDGVPGFDTQDYFKDVFGFKDQVSWSDVIGLLAEKDEDKNLWDKKWTQIVAGLALDIALDPLTWFGGWAVKATKTGQEVTKAQKLAMETAELAYKKGVQAGMNVREANRIYRNVANKLTKGWGFRVPWKAAKEQLPRRATEFAPFRKVLEGADIGRIAEEALPLVAKTTKRGIKALRTGPQWLSDVMRRYVPGYRFMEKAFDPRQQAYFKAIEAKLAMMRSVGADVTQLGIDLHRTVKNIKPEVLDAAVEYIEKMPYMNAKMVQEYADRADNINRIIVAFQKGDRKTILGAVGKVAKKNDDLFAELRREIMPLIENYDYRIMLKEEGYLPKTLKIPKPTTEEFLMVVGHIYDEASARSLQSMLMKEGLNWENMSSFATFKPKIKSFSKWLSGNKKQYYKELAKNLSVDQKKAADGLIDTVRQYYNYFHTNELKNGVPTAYIRDYLQGAGGAGVRKIGVPTELGGKESFLFHKESVKSIAEHRDEAITKLMNMGTARNRKHALKLLKEGSVPEFGRIVDGIHEMIYLRGVASYKAIWKQKFIDEVSKFGIKAPTQAIPKGMQITGIDELKDVMFDPDTAQYVNRIIESISNDEAVRRLLKMMDSIGRWWRPLVTSVNLGFHLRNWQSNHFLGFVWQGPSYFNPKRHRLASKIVGYRLFSKDQAILKELGIEQSRKWLDEVFEDTGRTVKEIIEEARPYALERHQFRFLEVTKTQNVVKAKSKFQQIAKKMNITGTDSALAWAGEKLGAMVESQARWAAFLNDFRVTKNVRMSALKVQEVFVDYSNLTQFEKQIARRVIPFFSWLKQNTANQVKFIFNQPGRYAKLPRIKQALEKGARKKVTEEEKPPYFRELWMWQLPITLPDGTPLFYNPNFPFQDLNKLDPSEWKRTLLTSMSPFIKTPIELLTGYEFFRERPIEKYPGYKAPVPGILQNIAGVLPENLRSKLGIERSKYGAYVMNPQMAHAISNFAPFLKNTSRLLMQEYKDMPAERYFQWVSYMWGVKIKPVHTLTQQYYNTVEAIRKRREELQRSGYAFQ